MHVLVVNAGSSSLKLSLLDPTNQVVASRDLDRPAGPGIDEQIRHFVSTVDRVDAVGHRIVHGGPDFPRPAVITGQVRDRIAALAELAPLHQPAGGGRY